MLDDFVRSIPGVVHAFVVSGDGLRVAASGRMHDGRLADQLSAATSGLASLARGAAHLLHFSPATQTIVEMAGGHLFATSIAEGSTLAVVADRRCDMGMIGYEMSMLAAQVGHALTPAPRASTGGGAAVTRQDPGVRRDAGRVVPAYALTLGRTRSAGQELPLESLVTATELAVRSESGLQMEGRTIVAMSLRPTSVMEIGAALQVPVGVARVLVSDLANAGYLQVHLPPTVDGSSGPGREILGRLLDGLRAR